MDASQAVLLTVEHIRDAELDHPTEDLIAEQFRGGWCVYHPDQLAERDEGYDEFIDYEEDLDGGGPRSVFLVGDSGRIKQVTSSEPAEDAREWFQESCVWFAAEEPGTPGDSPLPAHADLGGPTGSARTPASYDRAALDVLAQALVGERDFAGWLADRLGELADLVGGPSALVTRRPRSQHAARVLQLAEHDAPTEVWRTWDAPDPAALPEVDPDGWLLVPAAAVGEYLEGLEAERDAPAATRLADLLSERSRTAAPWRGCQVTELLPQLIALRRTEAIDADLAQLRALDPDARLDTVLAGPDSPDVAALLRLAIHAERTGSRVVELDAAAVAAYRRLLDRMNLPFDNYAYAAMFE